VSSILPDDAILLARDDQGQAYQFGDQLVIERRFGGKRIEARLPGADLDWLWNWNELMRDACQMLAHRQLT
jgi:hypothetical protein